MEVIPASLAIPLDALYGMLGGAWEGGSRALSPGSAES